MPQRRTIKNILVEAVVFVALLSSLGHTSVNFWERFMIQSELTHMKTSLHTLKEAVANIGDAYDELYTDLKHIAVLADEHPANIRNEGKITNQAIKANPLLALPLKLDIGNRNSQEIKPVLLKLEKKTFNSAVPKNNDVSSRNKMGTDQKTKNKPEQKCHIECKTFKTLVNVQPVNLSKIFPIEMHGIKKKLEQIPCKVRSTCRYRNGKPHSCSYSQCQYCHHRYDNPYRA